MATKCMSKKSAKITLTIGIIFLVLSVVLIVVFPTIYNSQLQKEITLNEGSLVTGIFEDIPLPIYEKLYFFNITNGDDFLSGKAPMNVTEAGPYTYKSRWTKTFKWHPNGTVSYRETRTYHFVREMSSGGEDDPVYTLNGPMIVAANFLSKKNFWLRVPLSIVLGIFTSESLIIKKTVKELGYGGYEDFIIKLAPLFMSDLPFKDGHFLWLYDKNATNDGLFTVFTGENDASKKGYLTNWNGNDKLNFWSGDTCNMINGTDIEIGPPLTEDTETYTFFQTIFCRSLTFNYTRDVDHYGITTKRFKPTNELFANRTDNPDNHCFNLDDGIPSGVLNVSACYFGAPVLISFPHFYMADTSFLKPILGLNPNSEEHESFMDVEPLIGISLNLFVRFQVNLKLEQVRGLFQFDGVPEGIFPVLWAELSLTLTEDWANYLKSKLRNPKIIAYSSLGILAGVSLILIIASIVILNISDDDDDEPLIDAKDDNKPSSWSNDYSEKPKLDRKVDKTQNQRSASEHGGNVDNARSGIINKAADFSSDVVYSGAETSELRTGDAGNEAAVLHVDMPRPKQ